MTTPRTRARRRAVATGSALIAAFLVSLVALATPAESHPLSGIPVLADTDTTTPNPPSDSPTAPAPTDTVTDTPTTSDPPPPPPPSPTPQPTSAPAAGVRLTVDDVTVPPGYWTGSTATSLRYRVTNTGGAAAQVTVAIALPDGLTARAPAGCRSLTRRTLGCGYASLAAGATVGGTVPLRVDPRAWRSAPLGAVVSARATLVGWSTVTARDQAGYAVVFPPGPPTPGISLLVTDVPVDAARTGVLSVRLRNTGAVAATARAEILGPQGSRLDGAPECVTGPTPQESRCEIGTLAAGAQEVLGLRLTLDPLAASGAVPLGGLVRAQLTPAGQDTIGTQASFLITMEAAQAGTQPSGSVGLAGAADDRPTRAVPPAIMPIDLSANPLAAVPIVGGLAGLLAVMCVLLVVGVRGQDPPMPVPPARPERPADVPVPVRPAIEASPADS